MATHPRVIDPDNPHWSSGVAFVVWVVSVLAILIVPSMFLLPYVLSVLPTDIATDEMMAFARTDKTAIVIQVLAIIPAHLVTIALAWLVVTRFRRQPFFESLGWKPGGFRWWHYIAILVGFFVVVAVVQSIVPEQENELIRILKSSRTAVYIVAILATFSAPIVEEVVYRGVLFSAFQRTFGAAGAFFLVTALFAIVHVPQYMPSYSTIFLLTLLSLTLTAIRMYTGNLLPCVILHTLFNGLQSVLLVAEPYLRKFVEMHPAAVHFFDR
jgi:uncharacterized protein